MNTPIEDTLFQDVLQSLKKIGPGTSKIRGRKKIKSKSHDQNITVFAIANAIVGDCNKRPQAKAYEFILKLMNIYHFATTYTMTTLTTRMWANAQRDGRPAEYRWRPLGNAAKFG